MKRFRYNLKIAIKPKLSPDRNRLVDEADRPKLQMYQAVTRAMKAHGLTEKQAIERYKRPLGICANCGCMAKTPKSRRCRTCIMAENARKGREYRKAGKHLVKRHCKQCGAVFIGTHMANLCPLHRADRPSKPPKPRKPKVRKPKPPKPPPPTKPPAIALRQIAPLPLNPKLPTRWEEVAPPRPLPKMAPPLPPRAKPKIVFAAPLPGRWELP